MSRKFPASNRSKHPAVFFPWETWGNLWTIVGGKGVPGETLRIPFGKIGGTLGNIREPPPLKNPIINIVEVIFVQKLHH